MAQARTIPWLLWPFMALWELLLLVLIITGRVFCLILALGLMIVGIALTMTVTGAAIGIPIAVLGLLLMVRSIF